MTLRPARVREPEVYLPSPSDSGASYRGVAGPAVGFVPARFAIPPDHPAALLRPRQRRNGGLYPSRGECQGV